MPTKEELEAQLKQLQEDLKKSQDKCVQLETKSKAPVYVAREKKIDKFTGSPSDDVDEWTEHILSHVNTRFHSVREKAEFIFDHLGGAARSEVKFRITLSKSSPEEIVDILKEIFGGKETITQLQQKFFSCNQEHGESLRDYSYKLMDIMGDINEKQPHLYGDKDSVLKQKFAEGVMNKGLRRELRRLNSERQELRFHGLRDKALEWLEDEKESKTHGRVNETSSSEATSIEDWKSLYEKQQKQLESLTEMVASLGRERSTSYRRPSQSQKDQRYQQPRPPRSQRDDAPAKQRTIICHYCKGPNHIAKNCVLKLNGRSNQSGNRIGNGSQLYKDSTN